MTASHNKRMKLTAHGLWSRTAVGRRSLCAVLSGQEVAWVVGELNYFSVQSQA